MRPALRKVGSLVLAVVVVFSMAGGPVGTAQADVADCTAGDVVLGGVFTFLNPEDTCGLYNDKEAKQDHAEAYKDGEAIQQHKSQFFTTLGNFRKQKRGPAWSEGKIAVVNSLNNGSNASVAKKRFNDSVERYYLSSIENSIQQFSAIQIQAEDEWRQNSSRVDINDPSLTGDTTIIGFVTVTQPLGSNNQTKRNVSFRTVIYEKSNGNHVLWVPEPYKIVGDNPRFPEDVQEFSDVYAPDINNNTSRISLVNSEQTLYYTSPPGSSVSDLAVIDSGEQGSYSANEWHLYRENVESDLTTIQENGDSYVDSVYTEYEAGNVNASDLLNPTDLASRTATQYNQTGQNSFVAAELANLGLGGDLNHSVTLNHTVNGNSTVRNGTMFYTGDDVSSWSTGQTYDMANLNGVVYLAVQNGSNSSAVYTYSSGNLTVEGAQNPKTGEEVTNVTMQTYHQNTSNASKLKDELAEMRQLQQEYEEAVDALTIGSVGSFDSPEAPESPFKDILPALAIGGLILFAVSQRS